MIIPNTTDNEPFNEPYPDCVPRSTYGLTQFWAEEYWLLNKIQEITSNYPQFDFTGLIKIPFKNHLHNILAKAPHNKIVNTKNYKEIPTNTWKIGQKKLNLATSHAPSRFKAEKYLKEYQEDFRIINVDAHVDIGFSNGIHGAWLTEDLTKITALIGGWKESNNQLKEDSSALAFIFPQIDTIQESTSFEEWIFQKKVYLTIDLDYFPIDNEYLGLSNYWHRNLFIGHAMNIKQRIQLLSLEKPPSNLINISEAIDIFPNVPYFYKEKVKSIETQADLLEDLLAKITSILKSNSVTLLGVDLVEYSPLCDWKQLTIKTLIHKFFDFYDLIDSVNE